MDDPRKPPPDNWLRTLLIVALATLSVTVAAGVLWQLLQSPDPQSPSNSAFRFIEGQPALQLLALAAISVTALIIAIRQYERAPTVPRWFETVVSICALVAALSIGLAAGFVLLTHPR